MRYFTASAQVNLDGTETRGCRGWDSFDQALAFLYSTMGKYVDNSQFAVMVIFDQRGQMKKIESWERVETPSEASFEEKDD